MRTGDSKHRKLFREVWQCTEGVNRKAYEQETVLESGFHSDSNCYSGSGCIYDKEPEYFQILIRSNIGGKFQHLGIQVAYDFWLGLNCNRKFVEKLAIIEKKREVD